jgi:hypothetical protein
MPIKSIVPAEKSMVNDPFGKGCVLDKLIGTPIIIGIGSESKPLAFSVPCIVPVPDIRITDIALSPVSLLKTNTLFDICLVKKPPVCILLYYIYIDSTLC